MYHLVKEVSEKIYALEKSNNNFEQNYDAVQKQLNSIEARNARQVGVLNILQGKLWQIWAEKRLDYRCMPDFTSEELANIRKQSKINQNVQN